MDSGWTGTDMNGNEMEDWQNGQLKRHAVFAGKLSMLQTVPLRLRVNQPTHFCSSALEDGTTPLPFKFLSRGLGLGSSAQPARLDAGAGPQGPLRLAQQPSGLGPPPTQRKVGRMKPTANKGPPNT